MYTAMSLKPVDRFDTKRNGSHTNFFVQFLFTAIPSFSYNIINLINK